MAVQSSATICNLLNQIYMKAVKLNLFFILLFATITIVADGQGANDWQMVVNQGHSALKIKMITNETTYCFNPATDTISFNAGKKKALKGLVAEVTLKGKTDPFFTSRKMSSDNMEMIIAMEDIFSELKNIKVPAKAKYVLSIKDKSVVKLKIFFELSEKQ
jgi:hypothetical protein